MAACFQGGGHILKPLKWYEDLHEAKGRDAQRAFLVEGNRAIGQMLVASPGRIMEILHTPEMQTPPEAFCPQRCVTQTQFKHIALSKSPAGPVAVVSIPEDIHSPLPPRNPGMRILALEDIQDPGNVGALIRSAAAFDFSGILCSDKCADPFSPKVVQASCGAIVSVWIRRTPQFITALSALRDGGCRIVAADVNGKPWTASPRLSGQTVLVLGNEGNGLSAQTIGLAHETIKIPINAAKVESLNVAASGAILMCLSRFFERDAGSAVAL